MTNKEYQASRKKSKEVNFSKILKSYKKHFKADRKSSVVRSLVCKECNCSAGTYYEAVRGL